MRLLNRVSNAGISILCFIMAVVFCSSVVKAQIPTNIPTKIVLSFENGSNGRFAVGEPIKGTVNGQNDAGMTYNTYPGGAVINVRIAAGNNFVDTTAGTPFTLPTTNLGAGTHSVTITDISTTTKLLGTPRNATLVAIEKLIVDASNPENECPAFTVVGTAVIVRAKPTPDAPFPNNKPTWTIDSKPAGSTVTAPTAGNATATINPDILGTYIIKAACGTSNKTFTIHALKVAFTEGINQSYGFDNYDPAAPTVPLVSPWKSVEVGGTDNAIATITPSTAATGVFFKSSDATKMTVSPASANASPQTITLTGVDKGTANANAHAGSATGSIAGTLQVATYFNNAMRVAIRVINEENDDVQTIQVGRGQANSVCITAGADGVLNSTRGGDDAIVGTSINTGNNGLCESVCHANDDPVIEFGKGLPNAVCVSPGTNAFLIQKIQ